MRRRRGGMSYFGVGLIALVVMVVVVYLGFTKAIPFRSHFEVQGVFRSANNIRPNSPVRIAGVTVGKVTKVEGSGTSTDGATVTMRISEKGRPIRKDATLKIRPRIFLEGNFFVDMTPGTPGAPELDDGDVIPVNQTATPVQLDQILTALQSDTREDLKTLLAEYSSALEGKGARGFNRSIEYWKPAYRDSALVADATLGILEHDLSKYVEHAGTVAAALDRNPEQLKSLITDFYATARGFARESDNLRASVRELPRTLRAAQPALGALNASFPSLRALARELRPGVRSSEPAIDASMPLVRELRGLVSKPELRGLTRDLRPAVRALAALSAESVPLYREVRRASSCQNEVILPWTKLTVPDPVFPAQSNVYQEAVKPLVGLAGESRSGDANGQWFRILTLGGRNLVTLKPGIFAVTPNPIEGTNPPAPKRPPVNRNDIPCETQAVPDLRSNAGPPPVQRQIDVTNPAYVKRLAKDKAAAVEWLKDQLKAEGLADELKVVDEDVTKSLLDRVAAATRADQAAQRARMRERTR